MTNEPTQSKDWSLLFANYGGRWVALADDEVTVLAAAAKQALAASAASGAPEPILYRVPENLDIVG
jgi:hypothetical protein